MKFMRAASFSIALLLLVVATMLYLDGKWGHLPTVVALASGLYVVIGLGFQLGLQKQRKSERQAQSEQRPGSL